MMPGSARQQDELLVMGRIASPYGVKGRVRVVSYTVLPGSLLEYRDWLIGRDGDWRTVRVLDGRPHGKGLVVQLEECTDRDAAAALGGTDIAVYRSQLPAADEHEYYWSDLLGLRVVTLEGRALGRVDHLIETGANDVLVVRGERERLVPFVQGQVVKEVDLGSGTIRVDWDADF